MATIEGRVILVEVFILKLAERPIPETDLHDLNIFVPPPQRAIPHLLIPHKEAPTVEIPVSD